MSLFQFILDDDATSALSLAHTYQIDVTKPTELLQSSDSFDQSAVLSPLDICLLHSSEACLDAFLHLPLVGEWIQSHADQLAFAGRNAYLWSLVFDGPRPLPIMLVLQSHAIPLTWRYPSGHLKDRTLLHSIGWWALCCLRAANQVYMATFQTSHEIVQQTCSMCQLVMDDFDFYEETPFLGCSIQTLDSFASHELLFPALKLLISRGAPVSKYSLTGQKPIHHAIANDNSPALRLLLDIDPEANAPDMGGNTLESLAFSHNSFRCLSLLKERGLSTRPARPLIAAVPGERPGSRPLRGHSQTGQTSGWSAR